MRWYVPYVLTPRLYGLFPGEAVDCYTLRQLGKYILFKRCVSVWRRWAYPTFGGALQFHYVDSGPGVVSPSVCTLLPMLTVNPVHKHTALTDLI